MNAKNLHLLIVESDMLIRTMLAMACRREFGHEVVGELGFDADVVERVGAARPDVLVLGLGRVDLRGPLVAERLRAAQPGLRILVCSWRLDPLSIHRVDQLGVQGFVDQFGCSVVDLGEALQVLGAGGTWFSERYLAAKRSLAADAHSFAKILSEAEQRVLHLAGAGLSDGEIADRLRISAATAQTHRSRILRKLGLEGTPKLIAYAMRHGFAEPEFGRVFERI